MLILFLNRAVLIETDCSDLDENLTDMKNPEMVNEETLTTRQAQCLQLIAAGKTSGNISSMLCISESTVNFHLKNVLTKLHANNRTHAVAKALSRSLIPPL